MFAAGAEFPAQLQSLADSLVKQRAVDTWMTLDHSQEYMLRFLARKGSAVEIRWQFYQTNKF